MPAAQSSKNVRPLCHEHLEEMRLHQSFLSANGDETQAMVYRCMEVGCLVQYDVTRGYFILTENGNGHEAGLVPKVTCPVDGAPMYLAETSEEKRDFRLWKCPQCGARRTNEESLVGQGISSNSGYSGGEGSAIGT
jgi:hypothetical protein